MNSSKQISSDLEYVRSVLDQARIRRSPTSIYLLWAGISLVGFSLADFGPGYMAPFWSVAGPLGVLLSAWLGRRYSHSLGQVRQELGKRYLWHWMGLVVAIWLAIPLGLKLHMPFSEFGQLMLLIVSCFYFTGGLHLERSMQWAGIPMLLGYGLLFFHPPYGWTATGVLVALTLVATGLLTGKVDAGT